MLRLAPEIQEYILALPDSTGRSTITEHALRMVIRMADFQRQIAALQACAD
jgi:hypothetical protein